MALMTVLFLVLIPQSLAQEETVYTGTLSAVMVESFSGEPLEGITVTLYHTYHNTTYNQTSDESGSVFLTVPWGECRLGIEYWNTTIPPEYYEFYTNEDIDENNTIQIDINQTFILQVFFTEEFSRDVDNDGSPNWWEDANGLDPFDDSDGISSGDDDDSTGDDDAGDDDDDSTGDDDTGPEEGEDEGDSGSGLFLIITFGMVFVLLLAMAALGYSKIRRERVLDHSTRQNIYDHIRENPGVHMRGIKNELELPMGVLNHHLYRLETEEMIKSRKDGQYKLYFPVGYRTESGPHLSKTQKAILDAIERAPGKTPGDYAKATDKSLKTVYYHVETLERQGLISIRKEGKMKMCFPVKNT